MPIATQEQSQLITLATQGLGSAESRRAYTQAVEDYLAWWAKNDKPPLSKASVLAWRLDMEHRRKLSPSTVALRMSAMRKLAAEAADAGVISQPDAAAIQRARSPKRRGVRTGHWLTAEEAQEMLDAPDPSTLMGLRDRAVLACLIGGGLRRSEVGALLVSDIRQLEGRWIIGDITGKGKRIRTIPIANWVAERILAYLETAGITEGPAIRAHTWEGVPRGVGIGSKGVYHVVSRYAASTSLRRLAPHDLRRTFAQLAYRNGATSEQIQHSLGHGSMLTTERYLGTRQNLADAPSDHLPLR